MLNYKDKILFLSIIMWSGLVLQMSGMEDKPNRGCCSLTGAIGRFIDSFRRPCIFTAARKGDCHRLSALLKNGENPDKTDDEGMTPLMHAAAAGHVDCIKLLIEHKASHTQKDQQGFTPFLRASFTGKLNAMHMLYALDPLVIKDQDNHGRTALIWAADHDQHTLIKPLMIMGIDPNKRDTKGWTAHMYAAHNGWERAFYKLIALGADFELRDNNGQKAGDLAAKNNYKKIGYLLALRKAIIAQEIFQGKPTTQSLMDNVSAQNYSEYQAKIVGEFTLACQKKNEHLYSVRKKKIYKVVETFPQDLSELTAEYLIYPERFKHRDAKKQTERHKQRDTQD